MINGVGASILNEADKLTPFDQTNRFNLHVDEAMTSGFFLKSTKASRIPREHFDPENSEHRIAYAQFIEHGKWTRQFFVEEPHLSVPHTILHKLAMHAIRYELEKVRSEDKN